jgi:hypothetical protein
MKLFSTFSIKLSAVLAAVCLNVGAAQAVGRAAAPAAPPVEPTHLFNMPTGRVVRSMDLEVSGSGVLFGDDGVSPIGNLALGLGDIAEMQLGNMELTSGLAGPDALTSVPAGGLKVVLPLHGYARGVSASFRRSATYTTRTLDGERQGNIGEFYTVVSLSNYASPQGTGWQGIKINTHLGANYIDANLDDGAVKKHFWRPVLGFEVWRDNAKARIIGEMGWNVHFTRAGKIEDIRVLVAGVRFFFSKHVTFDLGVRHQNNYDGISSSTIQSRLHIGLPTHVLRDRITGLQ